MLQVTNLEKNFGDRTLFKNVSFSLTPRERLAIVGRNGTGKSTLFKIILGEESPDGGEVTHPRGYRIGHLSQHLSFGAPNILKEACRGLPPGREDEEYMAEIILSGLGFSPQDFERPAHSFSGGFQIRVELARVLLSEPNLLLLDEPTNYLDIVSARWLEEHLREWSGEIMMISHDRAFLDAVSTHTMIVHRGGVRKMSGPTSKLYDIIKQDEAVYEQTRLNQEKKRRDMERFVERFKAKAGTAALAQSRAKMLEKMEIGEELQEEPALDFTFTAAPFHGKIMLTAEDLSFSYPPTSSQPHAVPILSHFNLTITHGERIAVIGKNGRGKSTLLRLLAGDLAPNQGAIKMSPHTKIGYFGQTNISRLSPALTIEDEIMQASLASSPRGAVDRTRVRGICGTMMFSGDDALKKISVLSGGEKSRVLLGKLLAQPTNLLLLDEPTNHLDVESVAALVESLESFDGTVVLVTHDEFMLRRLAKRIVLFDDRGVHLIEGNYEYFLEKYGWGEGDELTAVSSTPPPAPPPKETPKQGSTKPRSRSSLDRDIASTEKRIIEREKELKELQAKLLSESQKPGSAELAAKLSELSSKQSECEGEIEKLFEVLESLTKERGD